MRDRKSWGAQKADTRIAVSAFLALPSLRVKEKYGRLPSAKNERGTVFRNMHWQDVQERLEHGQARTWLAGTLLGLAGVAVLSSALVPEDRKAEEDRSPHKAAQEVMQKAEGPASPSWLRLRVEYWQQSGIESWYVEKVRPFVPAMEQERSALGSLCVRAPVEDMSHSQVLASNMHPIPLLDDRGQWDLVGYQSGSRGEQLTLQGYPVRWLQGAAVPVYEQMQARSNRLSEPRKPFSYVIRARGLGLKGPILRYAATVQKYARHYRIPAPLLFAVMQVESGGRQEAVSARNAVGLMQVQPQTAGLEVHRYLSRREETGKALSGNAGHAQGASAQGTPAAGPGSAAQEGPASPATPAPGTEEGTGKGAPQAAGSAPSGTDLHHVLSEPERNIFYGASYLHLLDKTYFGKVRDRETRLLCVVTAYNTGPGRLQRLFAQDPKKSLEIINSYTANGLYEEIRTRLFQEKTYSYIDKVITLMHQYERMGY